MVQGTEDFLKILGTMTNENVFIISHKGDILFDKFTNIIKFEKEHNFTKLERCIKRLEIYYLKKLMKKLIMRYGHLTFWYYLCNSAYDNFPFDNNQNKTFSFHHTTMRDRDSNSWFNEPTLEIGNIMKKKFKLNNYEIIRLRWGMTTSSNEDIKNNAHIDSPDKHKVILFYLNDSDTCFYKDEHNDIIEKICQKKLCNTF